jgi:pimeloyl-ACP methyl ester carboxylesterase
MGGMLFSALAVKQPELLKSLTTVGTPFLQGLELKKRESRLLQLARKITPDETRIRVPLKRLVGAAGNLAAMGAWLIDGTVLNKANMDRSVINLMAQEAIDDIPLRIFKEIGDRIFSADAEPYEGPYDFEEELGAIELPMMMISGSADRIAPPEAVFRSAGRVSSADLRYREMGLRFGDSIDYGHIDLLVGRDAPREVFPLVLSFIAEKDR